MITLIQALTIFIVMASSVAAHSVCKASQNRVAVVGGSLGGLAAANALHQLGWKVDVYERAPGPMDKKGSGLGFVHVPAWEALIQKPMMRRGRRASRSQGSFYYGDLWKFLYDALPREVVQFDKQIESIDGNFDQPVIDGKPYSLVVLCDGGFSRLRDQVFASSEEGERSKLGQPKYAGYVVWRGSVPESVLPRNLLNHIEEGVFKNGIYDTIVLRMAKDNGENLWTMGTFVATPEDSLSNFWSKQKDGASRHYTSDSESVDPSQTRLPEWFLDHFETKFAHVPGLPELVDMMIQKGEITPHPQFEFGATKVHNGRVILVGDAAHMASPRTAVGAHTAIMDALALREAFQEHPDSIDEAIELYSQSGIDRAQDLYARTREVSRQFVQ